MIRRFIFFLLILTSLFCLTSCFGGGGGGNGSLAGTVVREGTGELIPFPVLIVGRQYKSPLVPDQQFFGDGQGKFQGTLVESKYIVQISTSIDGPFYTWPDVIQVLEGQTTVVLFQLPEGY